MKKQLFLMLACTGLALTSCNDGQEESVLQNDGKGNVLITIDPFESANATRTNCDPSSNYAITWAEGDVIGIFPREGYQEPFEIPAAQKDQSSASFDGGYWALRSGLTYNAYYPFSKANFESANCKTTIPVTYLGQSQTGTACNVGAYDYTYSDWTPYNGSSINFNFHHIGSFLVLTLKIPATTTYTSLTINADSEVIPTTGTYDLTASTPAFTATTKASSLSMTLNSFSGTAGEDATFYMMMPPCDLSAATLTATLSTGSSTCTYSLDAFKIVASHLYEVTGTPKTSNITGTIDGWEPAETFTGLTFTAEEANSTITITQTDTPTSKSAGKVILYSTDAETWKTFTVGETSITLANVGDKVYFKSNDELPMCEGEYLYKKFEMTGKIAASGNIQSLMNYTNTLIEYCYDKLFCDCTSLISAPSLPATTLAHCCYGHMFQGCTSLVTAPEELPALTLATTCYYDMFYGCTSLTSAPKLPATNLGNHCYSYMFYNCTSLVTAPEELPALTLKDNCYEHMFHGCSLLATAPKLPSTELSSQCYNWMFVNCTSLTKAPDLPATELASYCYNYMFSGCSSLNYVKALFTRTPSDSYTQKWLDGVASSGTFVKNTAATWNVTGVNGIPSGWTVQTATE